MPDNMSPGRTTYLAAGLFAVTNGVPTLSVLVRANSVLPAMQMFAWAGRTDPFMLTAARISRMLQASTTHADLVHLRTVLSLSFLRDQRRTLLVRTPKA
jgi:hypothetical protein